MKVQPQMESVVVNDRTITGTFFTERAVIRYDFWEDEEFELKFSTDPKDWILERVDTGVCPLINNHYGARIGLVTGVAIDGGKGVFTAVLSRNAEGDAALNDFQDKIFGGISFGSDIGLLEETQKAVYTGIGRNRKLVSVAVKTAKKIELLEISRADIPANPDAIALMQLEMQNRYKKGENMSGARVTPTPEQDDNNQEEDISKIKAELATIRAERDNLNNELLTIKKSRDSLVRYGIQREKGEQLLSAAKISVSEFESVFSDRAADITRLNNLSDTESVAYFAGVDFWLTQSEKRSPQLPTENLSRGMVVPDSDKASSLTEAVNVEQNQEGESVAKEYLSGFVPKKLY